MVRFRDQGLFENLPSLSAACDDMEDVLARLDLQSAIQSSPSAVMALKVDVKEALVSQAVELAAAAHAYASAPAVADPELAQKMALSKSAFPVGGEAVMVAKCKEVLGVVTENLEALGPYGITQAKVTNLKKKIELFRSVETRPRQRKTAVSAATQQLRDLFEEADSILKSRIDKLVVQFEASAPEFYHEYQAARIIVGNATGRPTGEAPAAVVPAPNTAPTTKAA